MLWIGADPIQPRRGCGWGRGWWGRWPSGNRGNLQGGATRGSSSPPRSGSAGPDGRACACLHPKSCRALTYRSEPVEQKALARAPRDSVLRPGRKVCAIQRRRRGEGVGASGWGREAAARRARVSVPPAICASVSPRSPRPPRSRSLRPEPGALRLQPRRAPAAAARPPATLPLPLNSCAKYAALHLRGSRRPLTAASGAASPPRAPGRPAPPPPKPRAASSTRRATCAPHAPHPSGYLRCPSAHRSEAQGSILSIPPNHGCVWREGTWAPSWGAAW